MNPLKSIEKYFVNKHYSRNSGSGKSMYSFVRKNAISINVNSAEEIYSVYKDYGIIFNIVNDITSAIRNTPIWISDKNRKEITDSSSNRFLSLINKPNRFFNGNFLSSIAFELVLYGRCIILKKNYPLGADEYFIIKNIDIEEIEYEQKFSERIVKSIRYKVKKNDIFEIETIKNNLFEINLFERNIEDSFYSPIISCRSEIEAYANAIDALMNSYANGGANKMICFKNGADDYSYSETIIPENKEKLEEDLRQNFGKNSGDKKYVISEREVSVHDLSIPTQQLDVPNSKVELERSICNAFNYPPQLLAIKTGAYKSQTEAEEAFYIRCISPLANHILLFLDKVLFKTEIKGKIELDYSEYEFFASIKAKKGSSVQTIMQGLSNGVLSNIITKEEANNIFKEVV